MSNDRDGSEATTLCSLGVVDLDLSLSPDVFGLKAFDDSLPNTRMLPGSSPCELRLLLPDSKIGTDGFQDVIIENLSASTTWRSRHVSPSDVTALRRRWPKTVFKEMQRRGLEMKRLRRQAYRRPEWAYRHSQLGFCPMCKTLVESSLEVHMMCFHLELGQLWRCPVEWCAVWKCSVSDCREHFNEKHGGSASLDFGNVSRSFPPWTVTRNIWQAALRPDVSGIAVDVCLFHKAGCRLIHKYRVHKDPLPHPALREGIIPNLLSFVDRAMAIAQLTHLRISIPASGAPPGEVPADCFPGVVPPAGAAVTRRVSFAPEVSILKKEMMPEPADTAFPPDTSDVTLTGDAIRPAAPPVTSIKTVSPPPGFPQFSWPQEDWMLSGDPGLDPGLRFVTSWSTRILKERAADLPPLPLSPIAAEGSQDSITAQMGSSTDETITPVRVVASPTDHHKRPRKEYSAPSEDFLFKNVLWAPAVNVPRQSTRTDGSRNPRKIPRWRLAREGPFLNEPSSAPFGSWDQAVRSDIQHIARRTTLSP